MAKRRGKALKGKGQRSTNPTSNNVVKKKFMKKRNPKKTNATSNPKVDHSSSKIASAPTNAFASTLDLSRNDRKKQKNMEDDKHVSGFIFMCNGKTKPECYQYRVFGLPKGKIDVVNNINLDTKLFLFDTDMKVLYGIYQATTKGALDLEPMAFNGRFQAQVKFKIFKDCLPLPESAFNHAIKDNYADGPKFKQELSSAQVKKLVSLFRPIAKPPSTHNAHLRPKLAIQRSFESTRTEEVAKPYPLENSSSGLRYLPILETRSQHAVQHGVYDLFEPAMHVTHTQVDPRHVRLDAPPHRVEPYHLDWAHPQDSYRRTDNPVEIDHGHHQFGYGHQYHPSQLVMDREDISRVDYTPGYYSQHMSQRASHIAPLSQAGSSGLPHYGLLSPRHSYYTAGTSRDPSKVYGGSSHRPVVYGGSPQRPVSASFGSTDANIPISSYYSSASAATAAAARSSYR